MDLLKKYEFKNISLNIIFKQTFLKNIFRKIF